MLWNGGGGQSEIWARFDAMAERKLGKFDLRVKLLMLIQRWVSVWKLEDECVCGAKCGQNDNRPSTQRHASLWWSTRIVGRPPCREGNLTHATAWIRDASTLHCVCSSAEETNSSDSEQSLRSRWPLQLMLPTPCLRMKFPQIVETETTLALKSSSTMSLSLWGTRINVDRSIA